MSTRRRKPIMPTVIIMVGLLVGITGLLMLLLGIGVISPTVLNIPGINLSVQTATPGIVVMVIGFTVALAPILMAMWVDARRAAAVAMQVGVRRTAPKKAAPEEESPEEAAPEEAEVVHMPSYLEDVAYKQAEGERGGVV